MKIKNYLAFFVLLIIQIIGQKVSSQEIKDDTIYTSKTQLSVLYFPASITVCDYSEESAYTRFEKHVDNSMVSIKAKTKNPEPAILKVSEGKRNHRFYTSL